MDDIFALKRCEMDQQDDFPPFVHRAMMWVTSREPRYLNPIRWLIIAIVVFVALIVRFFLFVWELLSPSRR